MKRYPLSLLLCISTLALCIVLAIEQYTNIDIAIQSFFYDPIQKTWCISQTEHKTRFGIYFYYGIKQFLITSGIISLITVLFLYYKKTAITYRIALCKYLACLILVPLCIASLKSLTNVYCPNQVTLFDGYAPYIHLFDSYPESFKNSTGRCFPSGHATSGFVFMIVFYCLQDIGYTRYKWLGLTLGIILGGITGIYQMLRGEHFLSHVITTMILAWILIMIINRSISYLFYKKTLCSK